MTHLDDEELSALIDGEGDDEEERDGVAHVAACVDCAARLAAFRAVHAAVAVTPEPDRRRRDRAVDRALRELPAQLPGPPRQIRRQLPRWLPAAAAAAVVLAVLVGGGVVVSQGGSSSTASKASSSAGTSHALRAAAPAPGSAAAGLGPIATPEALAAALRAHQPGQAAPAQLAPTTGPLAPSAGCAAAAATAAGVAAGTPPDYQAPLVYAGTPATVFAFGPAGAGHATVEAGSGPGCRTLVGVAY